MSQHQPVGQDTNYAPRYLITCGILSGIVLILSVLRIYTKLRPEPRLTLADYFVAVSGVLSLSGYLVAAAAAASGWGHRTGFIPDSDRTEALKCLFVVEVLFVASLGLIRISFSLSLLRLSINVWWVTTLWVLIVIQVLFSAGWFIILFAWCRPFRLQWEYVPEFKCWDFKYLIIVSYVTSAVYTAMDLAYAIMPIKLVWKLRRPVREKILIGCLMATGLVATAMAGAKITTYDRFGHGDLLSNSVEPTFLSKLEEQLGLIAACIPCLKVPAEGLLKRMGVLSERCANSVTKPSFIATFRHNPGGGNDEGDNHALSHIQKRPSSHSLSSYHHHIGGTGPSALSHDPTNTSANDRMSISSHSNATPLEYSSITQPRLPERDNDGNTTARATTTRFTSSVNTTAPLPPLEDAAPAENPDGRGGGARGGRVRSRSIRELVGWEPV